MWKVNQAPLFSSFDVDREFYCILCCALSLCRYRKLWETLVLCMLRRCHVVAQRRKPALLPFQRCVALVNTSSGSREARNTFAAVFQRMFDQQGIATEVLVVPGPDAQRLASSLSIANLFREMGGALSQKRTEAQAPPTSTGSDSTTDADHVDEEDDSFVAICGGDGTINSVVNVIAMMRSGPDAEAVQRRACLLVPTGSTNSICHSLGISTVERSISCLSSRSSVSGEGEGARRRVVQLPIWEVKVNDVPVRYIISTVAVGTYARIVDRQNALAASDAEVVGLPSVKKKFRAAVFLETLWNSAGSGGWAPLRRLWRTSEDNVSNVSELRLTTYDDTHDGCRSGCGSSDAPLAVESPAADAVLSTIVATQLNYQRQGYSVTLPTATAITAPSSSSAPLRPSMSVMFTNAAEASRLRMLHLFWKEGRDRHVLQEDGVTQVRGIKEIFFRMPYDAPLVLDGEVVRIPSNSKIAMASRRSAEAADEVGEKHDTCSVSVRPMQPPRFLTVLIP
jgi:hypothetical protein